jgi:glycerol-3-phosphate dehydrogenase subunit C
VRPEKQGGGKTDVKVAYFAGCTGNYVEPGVGRATVLVLERNGCRPVFPKQGCCGVPQLFYADVKAFRKQASLNAGSLAREACDVVTTCTSCALALKHDYPPWLATDEAKIVAARTSDIMEYLTRLRDQGQLDAAFQRVELRLVYHAPCHLKALGGELIERRLSLLNSVPGVTVTWVDRGCCGLSGTFGMKRVNYEMSMTIGRPLFEEIERLAPDAVMTECPACKMQIEQGTGKAVFHPIRIIGAAYRLDRLELPALRPAAADQEGAPWGGSSRHSPLRSCEPSHVRRPACDGQSPG